MTGGQSTLDFTSQNEDKEQANQITSSNDIDLNLTVVNVTKEEHQLHLDYLERMKEETGTIPVWLSKDS